MGDGREAFKWRTAPGRRGRRVRRWLEPLVLLFGLFLAGPARAAETDQYYAWGRTPPDSTDVINRKINAEIRIALDTVNDIDEGRGYTCEGAAAIILWRFRLIGLHQIEYWAQVSDAVPSVPANTCAVGDYARGNIYRYSHPIWYPISFLALGHTIQIDGVSLGTDKLGHFFRQGWRYYRIYRTARKDGLSEETALEMAVRFGVKQEKGGLGVGANGIFSFADLESNWQGFRFFRSLCRQEPPRLVRTAQGWEMTIPFDLREYVNPGWDESFNSSAFTPVRWQGVRRALKSHCPMLEEPTVAEQRRRYRETWEKSTSQQLLERWAAAGEIPDPRLHSINAVCAEVRAEPANVSPPAEVAAPRGPVPALSPAGPEETGGQPASDGNR